MQTTFLDNAGTDIWTVDGCASMGKIPFKTDAYVWHLGCRMTVVRLPGNKLVLISPVQLNDKLAAELNALGEVSYIIAPSIFHDSYFLSALEYFPNAQGFVPEARDKIKNPELHNFPPHSELLALTGPDLLGQTMVGHRFQETVFCHPLSKSLIVADFTYNPGEEQSWVGRFFFTLFGAYGKACVPIYHRLAIADRAQLRQCLDTALAWDFDQILLAHGSNVLQDGKETFRRTWRWI